MSSLPFDFTVDESTQTVWINKTFDAELSLVWDAFTTAELLDQWWAPQPYQSKTIRMDFREGGRRFYAMVGPDGVEVGWHIQDFASIRPKTNFKILSFFADQHETPNLPGSVWDFDFSEQNGVTKVSIAIYNESLERMRMMIEMGFKEGFTVALNQLAGLLGSFNN
jgi:uncharacterized protein YndB with AHSA1/START domain